MYFQGKRIRASVPKLPEAQGDRGSFGEAFTAGDAVQLVTIGESTIAGVGVSTHEEGFSGTLAKELSTLLSVQIRWRVYARSGYTAASVTEKLVPKVEETPGLIVIGLGGNDAFKLQSPWVWCRDVNKLIVSLRSRFPNPPIIFCNMPPIKEFPAFTPLIKATIGNLVELLGEGLEDVVVRHNNVFYFGEVITLDEWIERVGVKAERSDFFSDGVHPSKLTYQTWAREVAVKISGDDALVEALGL